MAGIEFHVQDQAEANLYEQVNPHYVHLQRPSPDNVSVANEEGGSSEGGEGGEARGGGEAREGSEDGEAMLEGNRLKRTFNQQNEEEQSITKVIGMNDIKQYKLTTRIIQILFVSYGRCIHYSREW